MSTKSESGNNKKVEVQEENEDRSGKKGKILIDSGA